MIAEKVQPFKKLINKQKSNKQKKKVKINWFFGINSGNNYALDGGRNILLIRLSFLSAAGNFGRFGSHFFKTPIWH